ncbi:MAG: MFS transporter [Bacteroidota bacterium]|nr:MFS transporter [Bacteroidota bacterium]
MMQHIKGTRKVLNAWALYDWANSVYSLVIASTIFPIYYGVLFEQKQINTIEVFGITFISTALITFVTALAFLIVAFMSPLLSGIADFIGNKKVFMQFFCFLGAFSCIGLHWFSLEHIYLSLFFYLFSLIGFWGSLVFYNSYLPDIAYPEQQDSISAKGYSLGYVGSVVLLLINLVMIMGAEGEKAMQMMRISFVMVGIWWIGFAQYSFYILPKGNKNKGKITSRVFFKGFNELLQVKNKLSETPKLKTYLVAFFVYSMAVQTVMIVATYFGEQEIQWNEGEKSTGLIISILVIQIIAVMGAFLTSRLSAKIGNIPTLIIINVVWIFICVVAYFISLPIHFYLVAGLVGMVMGGIQSLSRSTYSKFLPQTQDTTSFFSFYDVAEKIGIVVGMGLYGFIIQLTGSMRNAIVFLAVFFIVGVVLLLRVLKVKETPITNNENSERLV